MTLSPTIANFKEKYVSHATSWLLYLLIVLIPFSIRYVFHSPIAYQTGAYSDFTSYSIYFSDFVLLGLVSLVAVFHMKHNLPKVWKYSAIGLAVWLIIELFLQSRDLLPLQIYFTVRLLFLMLFAATVAQISVSREKIAWIFTILGGIQALIASLQFYLQKSLGLYLLGESHLSSETLGVAKIVAHGTKMIRGYGTFPHSNLLAAYLVTTTLLNIYLLTKNIQKSRGIMLHLLLLLNVFGVFVSFSRGGIVSLGVGVAIFSGFMVVSKQWNNIKQAIMPALLAILISFIILAPYLATRTTVSDNATKERLFYTKIGWNIISEQPFTGVGAGTSVLHMKQYSPTQLEAWEVQPVHNFWLLGWAELGIGLIGLVILIVSPIILLFKRDLDMWNILLIAVSVAFLTLFMLDHYFYTIWPTQLLLWLIIGLNIREVTYGRVSQPK